jgi:hypothetical protein
MNRQHRPGAIMSAEFFVPVLAYADALDRKDWVAARVCFLSEIEADYRALRGTQERIGAGRVSSRR